MENNFHVEVNNYFRFQSLLRDCNTSFVAHSAKFYWVVMRVITLPIILGW
jgi:hypothetical protein